MDDSWAPLLRPTIMGIYRKELTSQNLETSLANCNLKETCLPNLNCEVCSTSSTHSDIAP